MCVLTKCLLTCVILAITLLSPVSGHSWVESLFAIGPDGKYTGAEGFPRGMVGRGSPEWLANPAPDETMNYLYEKLNNGFLCKDSQRAQTQSTNYPRLSAFPGGMIALRYQENGHVSFPGNQKGKMPHGGTIYIYGTAEPSPQEQLWDVHKKWNNDGTGGNRKGRLLSSQNFDDGQCYQAGAQSSSINDGRAKEHPSEGGLWCQNNILLPTDLPTDKLYTLYWVWDWHTMPKTSPNGDPTLEQIKNETYTTCLDIQGNSSAKKLSRRITPSEQDRQSSSGSNNAAIPAYVKQLDGGKNIQVNPMASSPGGSSSSSSAGLIASSSTAPVASQASVVTSPSATLLGGKPAPLVMVYPISTVMTTVTLSPTTLSPSTIQSTSTPSGPTTGAQHAPSIATGTPTKLAASATILSYSLSGPAFDSASIVGMATVLTAPGGPVSTSIIGTATVLTAPAGPASSAAAQLALTSSAYATAATALSTPATFATSFTTAVSPSLVKPSAVAESANISTASSTAGSNCTSSEQKPSKIFSRSQPLLRERSARFRPR